MKMFVTIQQIFDLAKVRVTSQGRVVTEGAARLIEPASKAALEEALSLRDASGGTVDVVAVGGPEVADSLREAQAIGADRAYLVSDPSVAGGDAFADATALSAAIRQAGGADIVLVGEGGALSGPMIAEFLGLTQVTRVSHARIDANGRLLADQAWDSGVRQVAAALPVLLTVAEEANSPRYAHAARVMSVFTEPTLTVWTASDVGVDVSAAGAHGSRTQVRRTAASDARTFGEKLTGTPQEQAKSLVGKLRARGIL